MVSWHNEPYLLEDQELPNLDQVGAAPLPNNNLNEVVTQYAQAAVDALHVDDLLGHIPLVRSALDAAQVIGSVRDQLLLTKIGIFLHALSSIPADERRSMTARLTRDAVFRHGVGEHLIELLDRLDGRRKPAMVGAVFAAYAFGQVDAKMLRRLNSAIQALPGIEFEALREVADENTPCVDQISLQALVTAGFASPNFSPDGTTYTLNSVGHSFLELELDRIRPSET